MIEYSFSRLCFKADIIEQLHDTDAFSVHTPSGTFCMTKAEFYNVFDNVVKTKSYIEKGVYHYPTIPAKALVFKIKD